MLSIKSVLVYLVIVCHFNCQGVKDSTTKCDIANTVAAASNPVFRELEKTAAIFKCMTAFHAGFHTTAMKYWNETVCMESRIESEVSLEERLYPSLQHIIRDQLSLQLANHFGTNVHKTLKFIEATNILPAESYEFLISELESYKVDLELRGMKGNGLIFQIGYKIKEKLGIESPSFKRLPKAVQLILLGKPLRLQNNQTGNYLAFNEFQNDESDSVNAKTISKGDITKSEPKLNWVFESEYNQTKWDNSRRFYSRNDLQIYDVQIKSNVECELENCTNYLTTKNAQKTEHEYSYRSESHTTYIADNMKFIPLLVADNMISITFLEEGSYYDSEEKVLSETTDGKLEFKSLWGGRYGVGYEDGANILEMNATWIVSESE